jgi:DNA-binding transcriptional LysR family regulator
VLTSEGEQLLASCRSLLVSAQLISEQAQLLRAGDSGLLRVAASPLEIEGVLSRFLPQYAKRYPNVEVQLSEAVGTAIALLERGDVHVAISVIDATAIQGSHLAIHPVAPLELLAACHVSYPLEKSNLIDIRRIATYPLLMPDASFRFRKTFDSVCQRARLKPKIVIESRSPHALLALAEAGLGLAVISTTVRTDRYALRMVRIADGAKPIRVPHAIVWNKRRPLPRYAEDFCQMLADRMRNPKRRIGAQQESI